MLLTPISAKVNLVDIRVTVLTMGSRGDVEPFVALGTGISGRGHEVTIASHERFRWNVENRGLRFWRLPGDRQQIFDHPAWANWQPSPWPPWAHARLLRTILAPLFDQITRDHFASACEGADGVLFVVATTA